MLPLKVAIMWHFHQPYYKKEGEFILPWVRLHGVKDYYDIPELFHEFPELKQTINFVPSLRLQIDDYLESSTVDKIQRLTMINSKDLTDENKIEILRLFFLCNTENMVLPYPRYRELFEKANNKDDSIKYFTEQDWRDLQIWYNLTWFGQSSRERPSIKRLFNKGKNFFEEEKNLLLSLHYEVLNQIKPQMKMLTLLGQLEICCSPFYHPILPLLCNSDVTLECDHRAALPEIPFIFPDDAMLQIENAIKFYEHHFGNKPVGMWPSEGSISDESLNIIAQSGIKWVASDEEVLSNSLKDKCKSTDKYFPVKFRTPSGNIAIMFRDHVLSDTIGFVYSRWNPFDAANDFCHRLRHIKSQLVNDLGEDCLKHAVVPIILDGENCWEFYPQDGLQFRRELYKLLANEYEFKTVTFAEATQDEHLNYLPEIKHIQAGSWINANFKIWIGNQENRIAWSMLAQARQALESRKPLLSEEKYQLAMNEILIAEGSDWFWWYCNEHNAENKDDFDVLFRWHIEQIYRIISIEIPEDVNTAISGRKPLIQLLEPSGAINPNIDGKLSSEIEWENAGCYDSAGTMSAMHQVGEFLGKVWFGSNDKLIYFRCDLTRQLLSEDSITFHFISPIQFQIVIKQQGASIISAKELKIIEFSYARDEIIEFCISKPIINNITEKQEIVLQIVSKSRDSELFYPRQGNLKLMV